MLRSLFNHRVLTIAIVGLIVVPLVGYVVLIYPHRTSFELNELKREYSQRRSEVSRVKQSQGNSPELSRAKAEFDAWQDAARERCMQIATTEGTTAEGTTALLLVTRWWPESSEAEEAHAQLLDATDALPMDVLGEVLNNAQVGKHDELETWRPFVARIITRVEREPDHADSAWVLSRASIFVNPDQYSTTSPCKEFVAIGELILNRFSDRIGIQNFCEVVGGQGNAAQWGLDYEPHLRQIIEVNPDRFVRCTAKFSLASIVRAGGIERQAEAEKLFAEFLVEFDGQTEYHAQGVEMGNRKAAQRILAGMRQHGLGKPAIETVGVDLDGQPMALADYRGKVVVLSFWATWCGPCMKAIPHEKELLEYFGNENFAIVGVNGDSQNPGRAHNAVQEHGITWRSFQSKRADGSSIDQDWHVGGWPTFYLLDSDGTIANTWQGMPSPPLMRTAIAELIDADQ
ncbi:TlpA family protein disulfide reductase [Roseimaritima ulvae]|uniref:Thiol-disulfide oxidoreductase ResA n=1 Tax=Roseimaritima ulvae TaxID=980254 RepID=A0A5B9QUG2_9BACT|nr:TlpA disulfide reductase family protein [Roseimaritima ulvae]QEG41599.1 Thiol-disulfide oxidoreductase ResA [Roseimaritima ulvae]